jgi:hypothetical protein
VEPKATIERIVQATGTSALRAAAQIILDHLPKGEMEEGEEKKIYDGILLSSNENNKDLHRGYGNQWRTGILSGAQASGNESIR